MQINTQRYTHQINKNEGSSYLYRSFYLELSPLPSENLLRKCETLFLGGFFKVVFLPHCHVPLLIYRWNIYNFVKQQSA